MAKITPSTLIIGLAIIMLVSGVIIMAQDRSKGVFLAVGLVFLVIGIAVRKKSGR